MRLQEGIVPDYLVIGFPHQSGCWAVVLPDFPGVTGRAGDSAQAVRRAVDGAASVIETLAKIQAPTPIPVDLRTAQQNHVWTREYGVDWSRAVVSTITLDAGQPAREPLPAAVSDRRRRRIRREPAKVETVNRSSGATVIAAPQDVPANRVPKPKARPIEAHIQ
jgi:predicted RNase H-like HicB family nuclease